MIKQKAPEIRSLFYFPFMKYFLFVLLTLSIGACASRSSKFREVRGYAQGTTYTITYFDHEQRDFSGAFDSLLLAIDASVSTYQETSLISRFNKDPRGILMDPVFKTVLVRSLEIAQESGGLFDPTVENLVSGWGFGSGNREIMTLEKVNALKSITGYDLIRVEGDSLLKTKSGVKLTFNAIAQGYSVDVLAEYLDSHGVWDYLVELGGETRVKGKNPESEAWKIGIEKTEASYDGVPFQAIASLSDISLVTSGNYRKFRVDSLTGRKYSHTINPLTGYPVNHSLLSATVLHPKAMDADAYATLLMVMGLDEGILFLQRKQMDAFLIYSDSTGTISTWVSDGFKKRLTPVNRPN